MNEKTFWLEANKRAIKARFRMFAEDVHKDPERFLKEEAQDHINLLKAIHEYREMPPEEQRDLSEAFEKFLDATIQVLKIFSEDFAIWEQAHQLLRQLGAPTYDRLLEELNHSNASVRQAVVLAFGGPDGQEEVWHFLAAVGHKLLTDPDPIVRRNAARTLELTRHPAATAYFVYALKHDTSARVRAWGAIGLEATGTLEHMLVLGQAARSDYTEGERNGPTVAETAARALIAIAEREKFPRTQLSSPPSEGLIEALAWGDEKGNIYECRIVQTLRQEESKLYTVELKYWDLPDRQDRLVERSQLLPESEISQLQSIWHQYCIQYGCPDELRLKLKGPEPTIRLSLELIASQLRAIRPFHFISRLSDEIEVGLAISKPLLLALGPKGEYLGVACLKEGKYKLRIWSICPLECLWQQPECDFPVKQITFSANGRVVAIAGEEHAWVYILFPSPIIWTTPTGQSIPIESKVLPLKKIECPYVRRITLSPDGRYLAVHRLLGQHKLEIWELREQSEYPKYEFPYKEVFSLVTCSSFNPSVAFSPDSRLLAIPKLSPGFAGFEIWDLNSGKKLKALGQEGLSPIEPRFSRDGSKLITIVEGLNPRLRGSTPPELLESPRTQLVLNLSEPGAIFRLLVAWNVETGAVDSEVFHVDGALEDVKDFLFSPYGECIAGVRESDKMIQLFIPAQGLTLTLGNTPQNQLIGFSSDGLALASVSLDDEIHIWELSSLLSSP